jgi:hypothetical protein
MKKLLVMATVLVAGMVSANGTTGKTIVEKEKSEKLLLLPPTYNWVTVVSPCGKVYFLDANNYSTPTDLLCAVIDFNIAKCGYSGILNDMLVEG